MHLLEKMNNLEKESEWNENNLQFLEEEATNLITDDRFQIDSLNEPKMLKDHSEEIDLDDNLISILKHQNNLLQNAITSKNKEIEDSEREKNTLKIHILKLEEQNIASESIINELNSSNAKYKNQNMILNEENKEMNEKYNELNYEIIELKQKLITKNSLQKINEKFYSLSSRAPTSTNKESLGDENEEEKKDDGELSKLEIKLNELEVENSKLKFEQNVLKNQVEIANIDKENEIAIMKSLHKKELDNYESYAKMLKSQLEDAYKSRNDNLITNNTDLDNLKQNSKLFLQISTLENKIRELDNENFKLKKALSKAQSETAETQIKLENKEQIIDKLQKEYQGAITQCQEQIANLEENQNILSNNDEENQKMIGALMQEKQDLIEKINQLNNGFIVMKQGLDEANELFMNKKTFMENEIANARTKTNEYKRKVQILKIKINELQEEIAFLKQENETLTLTFNQSQNNPIQVQTELVNHNLNQKIENI